MDFYRIKQFSAPGGSWFDVAAPIDCNTWVVKSASAQAVRSTSGDATTQDTLLANVQQSLTVGRPEGDKGYRYRAGDIVCSVLLSAPDTIVGTFVR